MNALDPAPIALLCAIRRLLWGAAGFKPFLIKMALLQRKAFTTGATQNATRRTRRPCLLCCSRLFLVISIGRLGLRATALPKELLTLFCSRLTFKYFQAAVNPPMWLNDSRVCRCYRRPCRRPRPSPLRSQLQLCCTQLLHQPA